MVRNSRRAAARRSGKIASRCPRPEPSRSSSRQRPERVDAARNREAILCAARRLVAEQGPASITMDRLAEAAGVGKGTLFRRFGDRASLFHALLDESERRLQEGFIRGPAPLGPGAPPRERLIAFGRALLELTAERGELLLAATPDTAQRAFDSPRSTRPTAATCITVLEAAEEPRPPTSPTSCSRRSPRSSCCTSSAQGTSSPSCSATGRSSSPECCQCG